MPTKNIRTLSTSEMQDTLKVIATLEELVDENGVLPRSYQAVEVVLSNTDGDQIVILWDDSQCEWLIKLCYYEDRAA